MDSSGSGVGQGGPAGLYAGFEAYRTPTDDDQRSALQTALVVFDTNVLLNLYRYSAATRGSVVDVVRALGDRFWLPHQVLEEFWRNRERALASPAGDVRDSAATLERNLAGATEVLRQWVNRAALTTEEAEPVLERLRSAFASAQQLVDRLVDEERINQARNTHNDEVLQILEPVLVGRVGQPMPRKDHDAAVEEGKRRAKAGEPPGFADAGKGGSPEGPAGDYLVWAQMLAEAESRGCDLVFVTGDVKRDWWRYEGSYPRGPRLELAREFHARTGQRLHMLTPTQLLTHADALAVTVEERSVENVERTTVTEPAGQPAQGSGWTRDLLDQLLRRLARAAPVQEQAIRWAVRQGGYVSREDVYEIGQYDPERKLIGFTRPVSRFGQQLKDEGLLPEDAADVLQPVYDEMRHGFGWVDGFAVPEEVVDLLTTS